ncbi:calcium-activated chloride channel regulator 4A-like [Saccoglossus kowalevskii]|uniref:Calcium-activated chloride channel regulator 4-like n=1 Tax=Saccoglossus kowalevskii TaxID=10224 RepID=A0ABM0GJ99_SACKO|nr:PREDICTED: calcium-activated chloride channel regulator 4-like [Saccoglossus kowalevskii]
MRVLLVHFFTFLLVSFADCRNPVSLEDNGYRDVLVAIHESIEEDPLLITRIKEIFTSASSHLHLATEYHTYFNNVTILIPKTWSDNLTEAAATTERFDLANVIVDQPNTNYGHNPYTKQILKCGDPGQYIHLTERWIKDKQFSWYYWGDSGKVIVHEWAHLRWGVYDEYPEEEYDHFYYDENGNVQPTRCSEAVTGKSLNISDNYKECNTDPSSGVMPSTGCRFFPDLDNNEATASYMYANYLDSVVTFCHGNDEKDQKAKHNRLARNKQNKQCCYQSVWEVMLQHSDFGEGNEPAVDINVTPSFLVVQEIELRIVLILDISGSMNTNDRFDLMIQASTKYIGYTVPSDTWLGIVEFSTDATILSYLVQLSDTDTRKQLIDKLPTGTGGSTCIGCGLNSGIEVLEHGWESPSGGILFLITDGDENVRPYIEDVIDELVEKEIVVDTLALSDEADPGLAELSEETGGTAYWYSESDSSTGLHDAFTDTITSRTSSSTSTPVQLSSYKTTIAAADTLSEYVYIDSTIGRHTVFFIFWDFSSTEAVHVVIKSPDGSIIEDGDTGKYLEDYNTRTITVAIEGLAQSGQWFYNITNPDSVDQVVEVSIESTSTDPDADPLRLQSTVGSELITESPPQVAIYATVHRGYEQILGANVIATIERPSPYDPIDLSLLDNGVGADITGDDGTYSGYFLDFVDAHCEQACRYAVQVTADDGHGTTNTRTLISTGAMPTNYDVIPTEGDPVPIGDFGRVASGGSFQVDENVHIPGEDEDPYPPSRISDLESPSSNYDEQTITLRWTAVGDDLDQGTAEYYDLRYSTSFSEILDHFDNATQITNDDLVVGNLTSPLPSGSEENFIVWLPTKGTGTTYYFAVRAVDKADNEGDISNVAQNTIVPIPTSGLEWWEIFLIILCCVLAIAIIVWVTVCAMHYCQMKNKTKDSSKTANTEDLDNPSYVVVY